MTSRPCRQEQAAAGRSRQRPAPRARSQRLFHVGLMLCRDARQGQGPAVRCGWSRPVSPPPFLKHDPNLSWGEKKYIKGGNHGVQRCARRVPRTAWPCSCREEERRARAGGGPGGVSEGRRTAALPAAAGAAALGAGPAGAAPPALPSRCPPAPALRAGLCCTARHRFCDGADSLCSPPWLPCPSRRLGAA